VPLLRQEWAEIQTLVLETVGEGGGKGVDGCIQERYAR
jgi:hypothetical protein